MRRHVEKVIPEMKELIENLRARGWRVVIVTASPSWIVEPGARRLGLGREDVFGIEVRHRREARAVGVRYVLSTAACGEGVHHVAYVSLLVLHVQARCADDYYCV